MMHDSHLKITVVIFIAVYLLVPIATLASAFLRSRGDERTFIALASSGFTLWVIFTTSFDHGEDRLGLGGMLSQAYLALVFMAAVIGGLLRFLLSRPGSKPTYAGNALLGFAIGVPVPFASLGRIGFLTHTPSVGVTIALTLVVAFLLHQTFFGRDRLRLQPPVDAYGFTCAALAMTLASAVFLAGFYPLQEPA